MPNNTNFPPAPKRVEDPFIPEGMATKADLEGYAKSEDVMPAADKISGYKANAAQTMQHDAAGAMKWVDNE